MTMMNWFIWPCSASNTVMSYSGSMRGYCAHWVLMFAAIGRDPSATALWHVLTTEPSDKSAKENSNEDSSLPVRVGAGLPPMPRKLVKQIQSSEFIDLIELLPDHLMEPTGVLASSSTGEKQRHISTILEWLQCFITYMSVVITTQPECNQDLFGYQSLITEAKMQYKGSRWLSYDCRFSQNTATQPDQKWSVMYNTLWNMLLAINVCTPRVHPL